MSFVMLICMYSCEMHTSSYSTHALIHTLIIEERTLIVWWCKPHSLFCFLSLKLYEADDIYFIFIREKCNQIMWHKWDQIQGRQEGLNRKEHTNSMEKALPSALGHQVKGRGWGHHQGGHFLQGHWTRREPDAEKPHSLGNRESHPEHLLMRRIRDTGSSWELPSTLQLRIPAGDRGQGCCQNQLWRQLLVPFLRAAWVTPQWERNRKISSLLS